LKAQLNKDFGSNAETILTTYRKSRLTATPSDLYVAITTARAMWLGSIEIAEKKYEQKAAPVYMYMFTHESNLLVPGTDHRLGAAHATEIWYKFDNVDLQEPKNAPGPSLIGTDPDRKKAARNMSEMWATFARDGHPGAKGQPVWPAYTSTSVNELRGACSERQRGTWLLTASQEKGGDHEKISSYSRRDGCAAVAEHLHVCTTRRVRAKFQESA